MPPYEIFYGILFIPDMPTHNNFPPRNWSKTIAMNLYESVSLLISFYGIPSVAIMADKLKSNVRK
jgi:hypothetical protein